ncbi:hypothetical protein CVT26_005613 [Gymnopilus dilepis]|uniref:Tyrosinase C-terminal domain-containing protein n=1 Tax=Gymnopilus dilepis TaxID=231916 RepID=A0A409XZJ9_9AGAR|nr:hypothetical protein CVT26_005613 [Gymnopilus dilepis]
MSSSAPTISYPESTIPRPLWEYVAHIRVSVDELRDLQAAPAASVRVFLGSPPSGPTEWPTAVNLAGAKGNINEGYVHLNAAISRHFQPGLFNPEVIVPYLTKTLQWRVQKGNGSPIEPESLNVIVFATPLSYPPDSICPVSGQRTYYKDITYGRKAGS